MNRTFLGDALDHWKGSLFESLRKSKLLKDFAVDPMASDWSDWQPRDKSAFAHLLRIDESQLISPEVGLLGRRKQHFDEIEHKGDLFLDPDTGIATGNVKNMNQYVRSEEIEMLLRDFSRLLAVYQHVSRQQVRDRVDAVCSKLNKDIDGVYWSSYESATVAMLFLSRSHQRVDEVAEHFKGVLGQHAGARIRTSTK